MKQKKTPPLGTIFLVPLRDGGHAPGLLARANGKGSAFGYFFGPRVPQGAKVHDDDIAPEKSLLIGIFGDLELVRGNWPEIGIASGWSSGRWPIPPMARVDDVAGRAWLTYYNDDLVCVKEVEIDPAEASRHPYDRMMGAGAVEVRLTNLIKAVENNVQDPHSVTLASSVRRTIRKGSFPTRT